MELLVSLWLPILASGVALFFASFLSWMVVMLHEGDWRKMPGESTVVDALRAANVPPGNYMFPGAESPAERSTPEFQARVTAGPMGVITVFPGMAMGRNLGLTFAFYVVASVCMAYLGTLGLKPGASFREVFRFFSTTAFLTLFAGIVPHSIWFRNRILGHLIESIACAAIVGAIFGALWPQA